MSSNSQSSKILVTGAGGFIGGALVAGLRPSGAIVIDSASFVASALIVARYVRDRGHPQQQRPGIRVSRGEAIAFIRATPAVRRAILIAYAVVAACKRLDGLRRSPK